MNRSVSLYFLDEGERWDKFKGHMGRNWGKYALGAAAVAAGGVAGAKGALGKTVQGGINTARTAVNTGLSNVAASGSVGKTAVDAIQKGTSLAKRGINAGIGYAKQGLQKGSTALLDANSKVRGMIT